MARRQHSLPQLDVRLPRYEWAFDAQGWPVPIEQAQRGKEYTCPLCGGRMIPRLGEIKQYHYAHDEETDCSPETVADGTPPAVSISFRRATSPGAHARSRRSSLGVSFRWDARTRAADSLSHARRGSSLRNSATVASSAIGASQNRP